MVESGVALVGSNGPGKGMAARYHPGTAEARPSGGMVRNPFHALVKGKPVFYISTG
jgi:hypothetical protein